LRLVVGEQLEEHVGEAEQRVRGEALARRELLRQREVRPVGEVIPVDEEELGVADRAVVELELGSCEGFWGHQVKGIVRRRWPDSKSSPSPMSISRPPRSCSPNGTSAIEQRSRCCRRRSISAPRSRANGAPTERAECSRRTDAG